MARTDRRGESRKKSPEETPRRGQQQEEEAEQVEVEVEQQQARDANQDRLGNQGVVELLGIPTVKPGQAGLAVEGHRDRDEENELLLGGDNVPPDGPLTLEDLVRSWNPTTRRGQDTPEQALGRPDGLPPEDEALLAAVRADRSPIELPASFAPDATIQPSEVAIASDLGPFVRQAARWGSGSVLHRAWARLLSPPAGALADPHGRMVFVRARASALATLLVADAWPRATPLVSFTLELACRADRVDEALDQVRASETRLPQAGRVLAPLLEGLPEGTAAPRPLPPSAVAQLEAALGDVLAVTSAATLLPSMSEPAPDEPDDDPLGIAALLADLTGGAPDPLAGVYDAGLQAAEKLAGACSRLRVHAAGTLAAVGSVCAPWTAGTPTAALVEVAATLDRDIGKVLQLLVEIGRAIRDGRCRPRGSGTACDARPG